ncbi:hypothetical protein PV416_44190 [Streptomyces ipomoeae]|uniref:hypothetical protein n=1 Tax=Streptomyces ipomoeae TaxID=103232 RepID=UPI001F3E1F7C|nr:hypothetical protein [Streptomyces ipomoeae]MDX2698328.1 hypothetical protein [Streptomyces ipomoeae]MDX2827870.1 hypothetical protein [Streptomyces ipomoeae]MDX2843965.1 hypothetical protein [Streptomyces ipomoeae]MDX2880423.1 hypothetical protein [Streptomyces ipomoeae]
MAVDGQELRALGRGRGSRSRGHRRLGVRRLRLPGRWRRVRVRLRCLRGLGVRLGRLRVRLA